jgi:hypothetical protein
MQKPGDRGWVVTIFTFPRGRWANSRRCADAAVDSSSREVCEGRSAQTQTATNTRETTQETRRDASDSVVQAASNLVSKAKVVDLKLAAAARRHGTQIAISRSDFDDMLPRKIANFTLEKL